MRSEHLPCFLVLVWQCTSMSVTLRRAHRCQPERLAGGGPRRPPGRARRPAHPEQERGPRGARHRRDQERSGERLLTPAGTSFYVRRAGAARRDPHYWTGARRNARADARSPGLMECSNLALTRVADRTRRRRARYKIDRRYMRRAGGPTAGPRSKLFANRLEKPVLVTGTSASACCPAAYE